MTRKFKAILPKRPNKTAMHKELVVGVEKTNDFVTAEFGKTYATWENRPTFEDKLTGTSTAAQKIVAEHWTINQIYEWVVRGTRRHPIDAKNAPFLVFNDTFQSKTLPGVIGSRQGFVGGGIVKKKHVEHPGTEGREYDKLIKEKAQPVFEANMSDAMRWAAEVSGNKI